MEQTNLDDRIERLRDSSANINKWTATMVGWFTLGACIEAVGINAGTLLSMATGAIAMGVSGSGFAYGVLESTQISRELAGLVIVQAQQAGSPEAQTPETS